MSTDLKNFFASSTLLWSTLEFFLVAWAIFISACASRSLRNPQILILSFFISVLTVKASSSLLYFLS